MFNRFSSLIGNENYMKVQNTSVMVIGVGGVGGYTVESLARCNIGTLILIDYDNVDKTNINRQIIATKDTIGKYKVEVFKERINTISDTKVVTIPEKFTSNLIEKYHPDFIVDACDDMTAKKEIIKICKEKNISFISSMGTGKRLDPSKLKITTLDKTNYDPLARILRKYVKDEGIKGKIPVLWSEEVPLKINAEDGIPSCSFVPSSAGLLITSYIIKEIMKH